MGIRFAIRGKPGSLPRAVVASEPDSGLESHEHTVADVPQRVYVFGEFGRPRIDFARPALRRSMRTKTVRHQLSLSLSRHEMVRSEAADNPHSELEQHGSGAVSRHMVGFR